jgi:hypothetical protein
MTYLKYIIETIGLTGILFHQSINLNITKIKIDKMYIRRECKKEK